MAAEPKRTRLEIEHRIAQIVEDITLGQKAARDIRPDQQLIADIGLDSLDYASVLLGCEHWLGIHIREDGVDWRRIRTVRELAAFLEEEQSAG